MVYEMSETFRVVIVCVLIAAIIASIIAAAFLDASVGTETAGHVKITKGGSNMVGCDVPHNLFCGELQKMVAIPESRFIELTEAEAMLNCLKAAGVDNWDGYSEAVQMAFGEEDE